MNIADWLYRTALNYPESPALFDGARERATYREFAENAYSVATGLAERYGVEEGDRVAIFMSNRVEYLEILYAIWWIGAVAVPINYKLHQKEATWVMENAEAKVVFVENEISRGVKQAERFRILVGGQQYSELVETPGITLNAPRKLQSSALAWLFYTSGTTGRPKGVMLSHDNLIAMSICYTVDVDEVSSSDTVLYAAPLSHGAGLYNFIHVRKAAKHVIPASRKFIPREIFDLAVNFRNATMFAAPTMVKRLVEHAKKNNCEGNGIKSIIYGGGPMYTTDIEQALEVLGPKFIQIYGQGESPMTITALQRELIADKCNPQWRERAASVGTAHSCVEVRVVDDEMNDLPAGETGEIIVRGPTVMQGYWRNNEATESTLVNGWLKTGDIGKLDIQGFLRLTDRSKDVIISGGANIYPREVEEVLARFPGVREVAVVGRPSDDWGEEVVAYISCTDNTSLDDIQLDNWCRDEIASFKKPKRYIFLPELPKNANGKISKRELL